jgi:L-asparaginase
VSAGFPSGSPSPVQKEALLQAAAAGVVVVQSSRAGSGRVVPETESLQRSGFVGGDTLTPQKARILLMLALTRTSDVADIKRMFATY